MSAWTAGPSTVPKADVRVRLLLDVPLHLLEQRDGFGELEATMDR
jgi:hypothetical protein